MNNSHWKLRATALAAGSLVIVYGAVGARQPAVRAEIPLPVPAAAIAKALDLPPADAPTLPLQITRTLYEAPSGQSPDAARRRDALRQVLWTPGEKTSDTIPLPLDPSIWRETILESQTPDQQLVAGIFYDRRAALLYYGLAALDDETLGWLGPSRATLQHIRSHAGVFAAFGRSIRVRAGRIVVPGGTEAEPIWSALVGEDPDKPDRFVQRLIRDDGRLAFFYDTIAHLDPPHQRFALGLHHHESARVDRTRALLAAFASTSPEWRVADRPFLRPQLDGAVMLSAVRVADHGELTGPLSRRFWERVFRGDDSVDVPFSEIGAGELRGADAAPVDAAWLAAQILRVPVTFGRRRLDAFLFAQRVFPSMEGLEPHGVANAVRGAWVFPTLMLTLERIGVAETGTYVAAARFAERISTMRPGPERRQVMALFQAGLGLVERASRSGGCPPDLARTLVQALVTPGADASEPPMPHLTRWLRDRFIAAIAPLGSESSTPAEAALLSAIAGVSRERPEAPLLEWEGARYRVDPAAGELRRLRAIRERQQGIALDDALARAAGAPAGGAERFDAEQALAETLTSILYAAHLGQPDGQAVTSGNVALRHDFGFAASASGIRSSSPWRLPAEDFTSRDGWKVRGSLLGLDVALARLSLRRLDPTAMPGPPRLGVNDVQTLMLTAALINPAVMTDATRDEIAAALSRGRARAAALTGDAAALDRAVRDAGLSEWRRQALIWHAQKNHGHPEQYFTPLELFWLGAPRAAALESLKGWGTAAQPLSGCLCLEMPAPRPAEEFLGRPAVGLLATRYADLALELAEAMHELRVPAPVAGAVFEFAIQDVIENAAPSHSGDVTAFGRAAAGLPRDRIADYIAALTIAGPLIPARPSSVRP